MISSDVSRGYNDSFILSILNEGDSYGYEISKQIRERTNGQYVMKETTLYSAFTRLKSKGYITSYPGKETQGRKRTYYKITVGGKGLLLEKQKEWQLTKSVVDIFFGGEI
ncbi:PadR family transcriptional regulator [Marinilactibacillus sp. Marseille-P9653]|uniref:PadR family transcriptional regulator n=1 Tax=Marinilactibacillus sp. Marseille-P9653 TaxID=2866583 RepID=UPI001CE4A7AE|nr:PadR family transcriptional regulator [Marinilactibacillus sp. Marseille-P9653]